MINQTTVVVLGAPKSTYITRDEETGEVMSVMGPTGQIMENLEPLDEIPDKIQLITID